MPPCPRLIQLLQMTLPILTVELEAPGSGRASVMSIELRLAVFPNSNPRLVAGSDSFKYFSLRTAEDRATLGSDPSAAVCSVRHDRPPIVEAVGLSGWSVVIVPGLPMR